MKSVFADHAAVHRSQCELCQVVGKVIRGMPVNFKRSANETVDLHINTELYELILHSDGILYRDSSHKHPIARPLARMELMHHLRVELGLTTTQPVACRCAYQSANRQRYRATW